MPETPTIHLRLAEVRLERFKAAFKPADPILFRPLNAIIGRNGAGKSTVLEAMQWIDTALRYDVRSACDRYNGVHDLINFRSPSKSRNFKVSLTWECDDRSDTKVVYSLKIGEGDDRRTPVILAENLALASRTKQDVLITTTDRGERRLRTSPNKEPVPFTYREKLLLGTAFAREATDPTGRYLGALRIYWRDAVFLRLSPNEMAKLSAPNRPSYAPILDESGRSLPALLKELSREQLADLIHSIQKALPDFSGVEVSKPIVPQGEVYYSLTEMMPSPGRTGRKKAPIPAWMLSEGTRRITAILALLQHDPPPTFLCIEEIENGLDPWTVVEVMKELQSASRRGIQVAVTTHSPWLLDHVPVADIIHVEREEGETVYTRFADRDEVRAYKGSVPPGAIYATEG
jgi:predicted ATPase